MSKCPGLRLEIGILKVCKTNCSKFLGKVKPLQQSINDADGFKMRAACVCVKSRKEQEVRSSSFKCTIMTHQKWLSGSPGDGHPRLDHPRGQGGAHGDRQPLRVCCQGGQGGGRRQRWLGWRRRSSFFVIFNWSLFQVSWADISASLRTRRRVTAPRCSCSTWRVSTPRSSGRSPSGRGGGSRSRRRRRSWRRTNRTTWSTLREWYRPNLVPPPPPQPPPQLNRDSQLFAHFRSSVQFQLTDQTLSRKQF